MVRAPASAAGGGGSNPTAGYPPVTQGTGVPPALGARAFPGEITLGRDPPGIARSCVQALLPLVWL